MLIKDWEYWEDKLSMGHMALFDIVIRIGYFHKYKNQYAQIKLAQKSFEYIINSR